MSNFAKANYSGIDFLISKTKKVFAYLQKAFIEVLIIYHFELKRHIQIKTMAFGFDIDGVLG